MFRKIILFVVFLSPMVGSLGFQIPFQILFMMGCFLALAVSIIVIQGNPQE